ncbi:WecB/TagA/CpsF family glycosyltransferase [Arenibacter sp. F26102]|uniref:WecB/TagA/CpsF family glycosyltransferase n=1 Tax=Arenibacter sp. F26102 TaxID=2926416 RepID=UPI001FF156CA|nr:WecB/TagA/CpsF family glycosyltransferase [Arenibacter sp. F26102]
MGYLNIYNYKILRKHFERIKAIDFFTLDGIMLAIFLRVFTGKKIKRKSPDFSSYFDPMFSFFDQNRKKVYFLGASQIDIEKFVSVIKVKYPKINVVGFRSGFDINEETIFKELIMKEVDACIVGLGTPKQELFMISARIAGFKGSCFACGAFFSQTAEKGVKYYPNLLSKLHLRWVYRIYKEPKLFNRYFFDYPVGLFYLIMDRFNLSKRREK